MPTAHFAPNSLFTEATAAIQGQYKRLNTRRLAADNGVSAEATPPANKISSVETTLSFAITPEISEVQILQSPSPSGRKSGSIRPEIFASILCDESSTKVKCKSKLCKNQITIVAMKITVKARSRKSFLRHLWDSLLA